MEVKPTVQLPSSPYIESHNPQIDEISPPTVRLLLKSIKRLSPPVDGSFVSVYLEISSPIEVFGPFNLDSSNEALLNIERCLQISLTLTLCQSINSGAREFINRQTVSITDVTSMTPLVFLGVNDVSYTLNYEILPGGCASAL
ncbi:hypothetical protein [Scytonema sp. NUACC26]|uniref:hypothetical protein n=1 Tax=Scytonema sp. NUACC26 TaxID=3140176 RepID=UPI0034DC209E